MISINLYDPSFEHDACGIGFIANIKGGKSRYQIISDALIVLKTMEHRGACGCENNTSDGAGIMIQIPQDFFSDECIRLSKPGEGDQLPGHKVDDGIRSTRHLAVAIVHHHLIRKGLRGEIGIIVIIRPVKNPPIDPIRERLVMSLASFAGNNGNLLVEDPLTCHSVALKQPILTNHELEKIRSIDTGLLQAKTLQGYFKADGKPGSMKAALDRICRYAVDAVEDGFKVLILQDRAIDSDHAAIPSLLAVAAVHHHLIRKGLRGEVGIIVEAASCWEVHHFTCLIALPGCNKNIPGAFIAMGQLNRPALMVYGSMYTANTMASGIEALSMSLAYSSSNTAPSEDKQKECAAAGKVIRLLLEKDIKPSDIMTRKALENTITVIMVLGDGTNAVFHLIAMARSVEIELTQGGFQVFKAINEGLLKVFSKMGISTLQSYQGAQVFEILELNRDLVDKYFTGATSRIEGMGLDEIAWETLTKHYFAFNKKDIPVDRLPVGGVYQWKRKGEFHLFNPQTIHLLQYFTRMNDYATFKKYSRLVNDQSEKACTLRSLLQFKKNRPSVSIDEVEPAENIYRRFATGAMSFGSKGSDTPLAVLSDQPQHLSSYFKQLFAQVTNPPIDPIRERLVMSLASFAGNNEILF